MQKYGCRLRPDRAILLSGFRSSLTHVLAGCCVFLCIEAAMVAEYAEAGTNKAGLAMGVAAFYLFLAVYSVGIDVAGVTFYSELFPNNMRAKGDRNPSDNKTLS
jgi:hypothetical protein